ncbi:MAG: hypothetical protein ACI91F_003446, partial [Candidatus Binatia bacterium]
GRASQHVLRLVSAEQENRVVMPERSSLGLRFFGGGLAGVEPDDLDASVLEWFDFERHFLNRHLVNLCTTCTVIK